MTECKLVTQNSSFKMMAVFSLIFVADTKITFDYNFVAPLKHLLLLLIKFVKDYSRADWDGLRDHLRDAP